MNAVWNSYGQLCGCPEIFKKSCKFFCRELDIRVAEMVESVIPAHAAGNQLVRQRMLAQSVPPRTNFLPAQTCYHQLVGYGGLPPCSPFALDLSHPNAGNLAMRLAPMVPIRP